MKYLDNLYNFTWLEATDENRELELLKYGEVFIYKGRIVPRNKLTKAVREWFRDEEEK